MTMSDHLKLDLYVSPHSATSPDRFWANLHSLFRDNVARYLAGEPLAAAKGHRQP
jgi:phosphoglycerate dehydrogenase-like enzyme